METAISFGNFDGVHCAHRILIERTMQTKFTPVVYTFKTHPAEVFGKSVEHITTNEQKVAIINSIGVADVHFEEPTKEFLSLSPHKFVEEILFKKLGCKFLAVGYDCSFGKGGKGDKNLLIELGKRFGFEVFVLEQMIINGDVVSSSNIRDFIKNGEMERANALLGREFAIRGKVEHGKKLGRTLGFPTANVFPERGNVLPQNGVYETEVTVGEKKHIGITNVGKNPTVMDKTVRTETHIIGLYSEIYDQIIEISFKKKIRNEKKFESVEELKKQVLEDIEEVKRRNEL